MDRYTLHEGVLPCGVVLGFEPSLFQLPAFLALRGEEPPVSFHLVDERAQKAVASIHFHLSGRLARSPFKAPFGSVAVSEEIQPVTLYDFIQRVEQRLLEKGVREILITNPPRSYSPAVLSLLESFLLNQGYIVASAQTSACIRVTPDSIVRGMKASEQQRLRKAKEDGLTCTREDTSQLAMIYDFISRCYSDKEYSLSIGFEDLRRMVNTFPDRYLLFLVRDRSKMVAASVSVRVKNDVVYNFLVNHESEYNRSSPPLLLMEGIYDYCRDNGVAIFDLGTSSLDGAPKFSLLDFKLRLGGQPSSKFTFRKLLSG